MAIRWTVQLPLAFTQATSTRTTDPWYGKLPWRLGCSVSASLCKADAGEPLGSELFTALIGAQLDFFSASFSSLALWQETCPPTTRNFSIFHNLPNWVKLPNMVHSTLLSRPFVGEVLNVSSPTYH